MVSKVLFTLCVLVAVAAALPAQPGGFGPGAWGPPGGMNPFIPPWVATAPWYPQWTPCTTVGAACVDCTTRAICTKIGGIQRACTDPTMPYCNLGACSATPSAECAPDATTSA